MKKFIKIIFIIICLFIIKEENNYNEYAYAYENNEINTNQIIEEQKDTIGLDEISNKSDEYLEETFEDINFTSLLKEAISGNIDNKSLIKKILNIFFKEGLESLKTIGLIIIIVIIHSILKTITDNLENKEISKIVFYVTYILIVTIILNNFSSNVQIIKNSIESLVNFMNILLPILITLLITTGNIVSAGMLEPVILYIITFIGNVIVKIIIPVIMAATALNIVANISDEIKIDKLAKLLNNSIIWILGIVLTIFVAVSSLEGGVTSSVDGVTAKATKAVVANAVPVVGNILKDAVETVIGCSNILKNAIGTVGIIVILAICIIPIVKMLTIMILYYFGAALIETIADEKVVKLLTNIGNTYKVLLGIMISVSVMLIVGIAIIIKISNNTVMF